MSSNDERRIPMDPERMVFSTKPELAELQKWRHYACCLLGLPAIRSLAKQGLVVVPREYVPALNRGAGASPNQKGQPGNQRPAADLASPHSGASAPKPSAFKAGAPLFIHHHTKEVT